MRFWMLSAGLWFLITKNESFHYNLFSYYSYIDWCTCILDTLWIKFGKNSTDSKRFGIQLWDQMGYSQNFIKKHVFCVHATLSWTFCLPYSQNGSRLARSPPTKCWKCHNKLFHTQKNVSTHHPSLLDQPSQTEMPQIVILTCVPLPHVASSQLIMVHHDRPSDEACKRSQLRVSLFPLHGLLCCESFGSGWRSVYLCLIGCGRLRSQDESCFLR